MRWNNVNVNEILVKWKYIYDFRMRILLTFPWMEVTVRIQFKISISKRKTVEL